MKNYQEDPLLFGSEGNLLGVIARPAEGVAPSGVGCLMFNFGVTHRVGPRRIQVKLARQLARQGIASLRFDLSGLGDSRMPSGARNFDDQAIDDVRQAIDELQRRLGVREVVICGLCSGVSHALQVALMDSRVTGLLSFDGYTYAGRSAKLQRRLQRLMKYPAQQIQHWVKVLLSTDKPGGDLLQNGGRSKVVTAEDFRSNMDSLVARGVAVFLIYSGTVQTRNRPHDQMQVLRGSKFLDKVRYDYMPELDHSFTEIAGQTAFLDAACGWIGEIETRKNKQWQASPELPSPDPVQAVVRSLSAAF
jgi:dienelactone hydrolase